MKICKKIYTEHFERVRRILQKRGYSYKITRTHFHVYDNSILTIVIFEDPRRTFVKYMFLDSATKWIIKSYVNEKFDQYGVSFKKQLDNIERIKGIL